MSLSQLKWLRFITPGILFLLFFSALGTATHLWNSIWPEKIQDALLTLTALIPAGLYYITPLRSSANERYFNIVTGTLRKRLLEICGLNADDDAVFPWSKLRGIFFSIIDSDKSLEKKASLAYFNGYIWTTLADIRAFSFCFSLVSVVFWLAGAPNGGLCAIAFFVLAVLTFPASKSVTDKHKEIGEEQIEIIEHNHLPLLKEKLEAVRARSDIGSD